MKKTAFLYLLFVVQLVLGQTPTTSENYVYTAQYLSADGSKKAETIQYFDALGRPKQVISVKATPQGKDLVVPFEYDLLGRPSRDILPIPMPTTNLGIQTVSEATANSYYGVPNAYTEQKLEASPLGRVLEVAHPGAEWGMNSGHTQKIDYDVNTPEDQVKKYTAANIWQNATAKAAIPTVSYYEASTLLKNTVTDEDGNKKTEFKNSLGQTILVRKTGSQQQDTYYIYNNYGQLVYVISPLADEMISGGGNVVTQQILDDLCYQYKYDNRNKQVEKKLPGKGWEYFVYDQQNRLVASQDANQRMNGQWLFSRYDKFGRVVYTGSFSGSTRLQEQANANAKGLNNESRSTSAFTASEQQVLYTNTAYPSGNFSLYTINYYDTYPGTNPSNTFPQPFSILSQTTLMSSVGMTVNGVSSIRGTKAMPTTSLVKNIEDNGWTRNYVWYDTQGRVIGTQSINHLGGYTRTETELDFAGVPQKNNTYHSRDGGNEVTVKERFVYNTKNVLLKHYHQVDGNPEILLTENTYNELGQLTNKKVGDNLQSIDYQYNIRGWLTGINDPSNLNNSKLFGYTIRYQNPENTELAEGRYNGNISEISWKTKSDDVLKRYSYTYDPFGRLTAAQFSNPDASVPVNHWNDEIIDYDLNGNILHLTRNARSLTGNMAEVIDELSYGYSGNRLMTVSDDSGNPTGYENGGNPMGYDGNGNMTSMPDKNINEIGYNFLNLPNVMKIQDNLNKMFYTYRADGTKLRKIFNYTKEDGSVFTTITEYLSGFQYLTTAGSKPTEVNPMDFAYEQEAFIKEAGEEELTPTLKFFPTAEGFYDYENNEYIYQYRDHLGNARLSYRKTDSGAEITDQNNYYPFGMNIPREEKALFGTASLYNYKYNSKELQETGMYDYGARFYMPDIGRWGVIDPLAEQMRRYSPYTYAFNNPVLFIDPDGRRPEAGQSGIYYDWDEGQYIDSSTGNISTFDAAMAQHYSSNGGANVFKSNYMYFDFSGGAGGGTGGSSLSPWMQANIGGGFNFSQFDFKQFGAEDCCPDGKTPGDFIKEQFNSFKKSILDGFANFGDAFNLTKDWFNGTGNTNRKITMDRIVDSLKDAPSVNKARDYWYAKADRLNSSTVQVTNFSGKFGLKGLVDSGMSPFKQFIGSMTINVYSDGENLTFEVWNKTSFKSFFYWS